jgi:ABC-type branched-subunit amino acid transport system substrate-binding protein
MDLAVDQINGTGGLFGRPLELRFSDTRGIPAVGEGAARDLHAQGASVLLGEYHSVVADAISASTWLQIPFICSSAVLDSITARRSPWVFRICPPQSRGWGLFARYVQEAGFRRIVSLVEPSPYWNSGAGIIRRVLTASNVEVVEVEIGRQGDVNQAVAKVLSNLSPRLFILLLVGYPESVRSVRNCATSLAGRLSRWAIQRGGRSLRIGMKRSVRASALSHFCPT